MRCVQRRARPRPLHLNLPPRAPTPLINYGVRLRHKVRDRATVSRNMSAIRRRGTAIERRLGSAMWKAGLRYRKQYPIVGKPDFAFPKAKVAVFCDSEFWHGYGWGEIRRAEFRTNSEFWIAKIERNIQRDREVDEELRAQGWLVVRFWGSEITKSVEECVNRVSTALSTRGEA